MNEIRPLQAKEKQLRADFAKEQEVVTDLTTKMEASETAFKHVCDNRKLRDSWFQRRGEFISVMEDLNEGPSPEEASSTPELLG